MRWRWFLLLFAVLVHPLVRADEAPDAAQAERLALLQQVQTAARSLDYAGIYTYQQGVTLVSSRIVHLVDGTGERERVELLDGQPRESVRHNDEVRNLLPERKVVVIERRGGERFPGLLLGDGRDLGRYYDVVPLSPTERVAGRECTPVRLRPRDAHRYGHILCIDARSRLLLKAQTVTASNEVIDQIAFSSITLGEQAAQVSVEPSWDTRQWQVIELPFTPVDLSRGGWRIPLPVGFSIMAQVSRPLRPRAEVKQMVLSDGLAAISIFVESYDAARHQATEQGGMHKGALSVFRKRFGDFWLTALGQVPADTLRDIVEHVEYVPLAH